MTIAQAFNEITVAQGGTPSNSGTVAGAIDALNDALAGSDQPAEQTIEAAVRLLGQHIGGGSTPTGTINITENGEGIDVAQYAYADVSVSGGGLVTILDDDLTFTYGANSFDNPEARYATTDSSIINEFALAYGNVYSIVLDEAKTIGTGETTYLAGFSGYIEIGGAEYSLEWGLAENEQTMLELSISVVNYDSTSTDATLTAWCANEHHVTIKGVNLFQ